jgi:serine/threonine-protein kinase RsbT
MGALKPYFSTPIAKALIGLSARRAKVGPDELTFESVPGVVDALERALPAYIADHARRGECVQGLRRLLALAAPGEAGAARQPPAAAAVETPRASTVISIRTADDVSNACEVGRDIARRVGFSHVDQTKIATAISELARNILLYAETGEVHVASVGAPRRGIEVTAVDRGPGIADVAAVMRQGYRSRTGMGMGLKGAKRLTDFFDVSSAPGIGTKVTVRKFLP